MMDPLNGLVKRFNVMSIGDFASFMMCVARCKQDTVYRYKYSGQGQVHDDK